MNAIFSNGLNGNISDTSESNAVKGSQQPVAKGDLMQMQIDGEEITYKNLPELRGKLAELLAKITQERQAHDAESSRLARQEKKIRKVLGDDAAPAPAKGAAHE